MEAASGELSAARLPLARAETLPPHAYTSPEFYRREVERIFLIIKAQREY